MSLEELLELERLLQRRHELLPRLGFRAAPRLRVELTKLCVSLDAELDPARPAAEASSGIEFEDQGAAAGSRTNTKVSLPDVFALAQARGVRGLVLFGEPGTGKTTFLKQVLLGILREGPESLGLPAGTMPVFLPLRELIDASQQLGDFIQDQLGDRTGAFEPDFGSRLVQTGKLLLLLDGLDEIADPKARAQTARWIEQVLHGPGDNYILASCRYAGYSDKVELDTAFEELHLRALDDAQMTELVHNWYELVARRFGDSWWQEVMLVLLAQPGAYEPFMRALVREPIFADKWDSVEMQLCLGEAPSPSPAPLVEFLTAARGAELGSRQLAAAKLLARTAPAALEDLAEILREHPAPAVRGWWRERTGSIGVSTKVVHGVELVLIPEGRFLMGSAEGDELAYDSERPQHEVELASFYLAKTPVTNAQYEAFLDANPSAPRPVYWGNRRYNQPQQPVVGVSWEEAQAYCEWAGLVLPTEAQWEYACRAGTTTRYWSGDDESDLAKVGWYDGNSEGHLHPVGEKPPNPFGLLDMHGNVWEWCLDGWVGDYTKAPREGDGLRQEPVGVAERVIRGGSWLSAADGARSAYRGGWHPGFRDIFLGFRPAQGHP